MNTHVESKIETKIDKLIEEGFYSDFQNSAQKILTNIFNVITSKEDLQRIAKAEKEAQKRREKYLKDNNVDINHIKNILKKNEPINIKISFILKEIFMDLKDTTPKDILKVVLMVAFLFIFHTILLQIFIAIIHNELLAFFLLAILVAPLTEEMMKRFSIKTQQSGKFFIGFNLAEATSYIIQMMNGGFSAGFAIFVRLLAALMHLTTTVLHSKGDIQDKLRKDLKIKVDDENYFKNEASKMAQAVHMVWNMGFAILTPILAALSLNNGAPVSKPKNISGGRMSYNQLQPAYTTK
jgi:hypothetical protein